MRIVHIALGFAVPGLEGCGLDRDAARSGDDCRVLVRLDSKHRQTAADEP